MTTHSTDIRYTLVGDDYHVPTCMFGANGGQVMFSALDCVYVATQGAGEGHTCEYLGTTLTRLL